MTKTKLEYDEIFDQKINDFEQNTVSVEDELDIPDLKVDINVTFDSIESKGDKEDFISDMQYLRTKLLQGIAQADQILNSLMKRIKIDDELTTVDAAPKGFYRYYEVSSQILKQICDASKELVNLHSSNTKIKKDMGWNAEDEIKDVTDGLEKVNKVKSDLRSIVNELKEFEKESK